ncbi:putative RING-H2 finger protein ATL12 [Nymphaea colorata]|uniref:putative RING-H2 finger protein ATL12 n=1 Tax=Nymphaea colorata TaxID=210225 RepID=UPI00129DE01D|nr:putative RING-H2 finger protein ATL12 [Nymphaea colorata]
MGDLQPTLALVASYIILSFSFFFIFVVVYVVCCRYVRRNRNSDASDRLPSFGMPARSSGIDKRIIASLPLFRFSSLRSSRVGLVCAICLSKFEETDILHLLPKCRHGFHISCVDAWLEMHSSCPLCRQRVETDDISSFVPLSVLVGSSNSIEFSDRDESAEINEQASPSPAPGPQMGSNRSAKKEDEDGGGRSSQSSEHRIVINEVDEKYSRHNDVGGLDLTFLNSQMINSIAEQRFAARESCSKQGPIMV